MRHSTLFVLVVAALEVGCGAKLPSVKPFKMDIQQGNVVTSKMLLQLRPGMTRSQVRYIMGTPLVVDGFRDNRWDYFYELRKQGVLVEKRRVILDFDKDALLSVRGDVIPEGGQSSENAAVSTLKESEKESSWSDTLMFWKSKEGDKQNTDSKNGQSKAETSKTQAVVEPVAAPQAQSNPSATIQSNDASHDLISATPISPAPSEPVPEGQQLAVAVLPSQPPKLAKDVTEEAAASAPQPSTASESAHHEVPASAAAIIADHAADADYAGYMQTGVDEEIVPYIPEGEYVEPSGAVMQDKSTKPSTVSVKAKSVTKANKVSATTKAAAKTTAQKAEAVPVAVAATATTLPSQANVAHVPDATAETPAAKAVVADEVVPLIPVGEYAATEIAANTPSTVVAEASKQEVLPNQPASVTQESSVDPAQAADAKPEPATQPVVEAKVIAQPAAASVSAAQVAANSAAKVEDDEVVPFIPEGEYVEPVIPTPEEMEKGNLEADATKQVDAETKTVTEKGVAPVVTNEKSAEPVFVQEAMPEPLAEPEPVLPPPPVKSAVAPVVPAQPESVGKADAKIADAPAAVTTETKVKQPEAMPAIVPQVVGAGEAPVKVDGRQPVALATKVDTVTMDAPAGNASIEYAVLIWADAWRKKDISRYLAAYATDFVPEGLPSKKAWEAQRKQRLSAKQGAITLDIGALDIVRNGNQASVTFNQKYAAKAYHDDLTKTLDLRYSATQKTWLITREAVQSAHVAPLAVAAPVANEPKLDIVQPVVSAATSPVSPESVEAAPVKAVVSADAGIDKAVEAWAQAWRGKNITAYLAAYAPDFVPEGLPSKSAWEAQRKQRLSAKQGAITLELGALDVQRHGDEATVSFNQKYAAKSYRDDMQKTLKLRYYADKKAWLIIRESAVASSPDASSKKPVVPEGTATQVDSVADPIGF